MSHPEVKYMAHDTAIATNEFLTGIAFLIEAGKCKANKPMNNGLVTPWVIREHVSTFKGIWVGTDMLTPRRCQLGMQTISILTNMRYACVPVSGGGGAVDVMFRTQRSLTQRTRAR